MAHGQEAYRQHVRTYIVIFAALATLTIITVAVSYLHLATAAAITLAIFIASVKAALVGAFFMHLINEKRVIASLLLLTAVVLIVLLLIPSLMSAS